MREWDVRDPLLTWQLAEWSARRLASVTLWLIYSLALIGSAGDGTKQVTCRFARCVHNYAWDMITFYRSTLCCRPVSVCPSVCLFLSKVDVVLTKQINVRSPKQRRTRAQANRWIMTKLTPSLTSHSISPFPFLPMPKIMLKLEWFRLSEAPDADRVGYKIGESRQITIIFRKFYNDYRMVTLPMTFSVPGWSASRVSCSFKVKSHEIWALLDLIKIASSPRQMAGSWPNSLLQ